MGHFFKTRSDTEVIVHAYEEWNTECLSHLRGMFAFAIYDRHKDWIFAARDRMGIKPFYYYLDDDSFIFASEIKAVLSAIEKDKHILNDPYVARFIIFGLLNDGADTFFSTIVAPNLGNNTGISSEKKSYIPFNCAW